MGLLDKIFGTSSSGTENNSQQGSQESDGGDVPEQSPGFAGKGIEFAIDKVRKYYNKKAEFISKIAKLKRECSFFDSNLNSKDIERKIEEIKNLLCEIENKMLELGKKKDTLKSHEKAIEKYQSDLTVLNEKLGRTPTYNPTERQKLETEINKTEKYMAMYSDLALRQRNDIEEIEKAIAELKKSVKDMAGDVLALIASDPDCDIDICKTFIEEYQLDNDYSNIAIPAFEEYQAGNFDKAYTLLNEYCRQREQSDFHISFIFGKLLYINKRYEDARKHLEYAVIYLPQSKEIHQMLEEIYRESGDAANMQIEKEINKMLEV